MTRWVAVVLSLATILLATGAPTPHGNVAVLGLAVAAMLLSALVLRAGSDHRDSASGVTVLGPARDERCLRGAFRRQSSPDTPGRPCRARAPGRGPRLA
ncbi:MAG: DUF6412 domain-containing protein [Sciscionella sp.]